MVCGWFFFFFNFNQGISKTHKRDKSQEYPRLPKKVGECLPVIGTYFNAFLIRITE